MNEEKNSGDIIKSEFSQGQLTIIQSSKVVKNGIQIAKTSAKTTKAGVKAGKNAFSFIGKAISLFGLSQWIIILVIFVILICLLVPVTFANMKDGDKNIYNYSDMFNNVMSEARKVTQEAIETAYNKTKKKIEDNARGIIQEKYPDDTDYITINYNMDDINTTAANITGYIQAVNAVLINYLPEEADGSHNGGLDVEKDLSVKQENEYNSLGKKYKKIVSAYAEDKLFKIITKEDIQRKEIKVLVTDEDGLPILDERGNMQYETKIVNSGSINIDVRYNIADYKKDDIKRAAEIYFEQMDGSIDKVSTAKSIITSAITDMLYILTGSRNIPSAHTYPNSCWNILTGVGESTSTGGSLHYDGVTSDGWTFPSPERVGLAAGTWEYAGGGEHLGVDLAVPLKTPLLAMADGVVLRAADGDTATGWLGSSSCGAGGTIGGGNQVEILVTVKDKLYAVMYCHMTVGLLVSTGQKVKAGDVLGYSGATGNVTGPHCHIEIFYIGSADQFDSYAANWNGDWSNGARWQTYYSGSNRKCSETVSAPCRIRPEEVLGME